MINRLLSVRRSAPDDDTALINPAHLVCAINVWAKADPDIWEGIRLELSNGAVIVSPWSLDELEDHLARWAAGDQFAVESL